MRLCLFEDPAQYEVDGHICRLFSKLLYYVVEGSVLLLDAVKLNELTVATKSKKCYNSTLIQPFNGSDLKQLSMNLLVLADRANLRKSFGNSYSPMCCPSFSSTRLWALLFKRAFRLSGTIIFSTASLYFSRQLFVPERRKRRTEHNWQHLWHIRQRQLSARISVRAKWLLACHSMSRRWILVPAA